MFSFRFLLLLFIVIPLIEIYLLVKVGGMIGAVPTIVLVVFTAVLGTFLLRAQGLATLSRVQANLAAGQVPALEMVEGLVLLVCGALLLTPGFFTDTIGFLLLITPLRRRLILAGMAHFRVPVKPDPAAPSKSAGDGPKTLEGEFRREDD